MKLYSENPIKCLCHAPTVVLFHICNLVSPCDIELTSRCSPTEYLLTTALAHFESKKYFKSLNFSFHAMTSNET